MNNQSKPDAASQPVLILAGSSSQYTEARRKLDLLPAEASWLTRVSNLTGKHRPKVFRFGDWKSLPNIKQIEEALEAAEAEMKDI
ncbi:MAG: hypothetical protein JST84_08745 [Acidobacteria bacterium]|nr:hypothetical protein [Acidobacteriota bacterium]